MIELRNISFRYNSRPVLSGIHFRLHPGQRVGLLGANGSGKTTLCHIIMGLLKPHGGEVWAFGRKREREADFEEVRRKVGLLFQDPDDQLFCPTVMEDVAFGPLNLGYSPEQARAIVADTLAGLGLTGFEERLTYQLSGGEKRLVSLATVLAMRPQVLLLDEPTTGLDEETTKRLSHLLVSSDLTYVVISHDRAFVQETSEIQLRLEGGRVIEDTHT